LKRKAEEELEVYIFFNSFHMYLGFLLWP
jgi:hypothetical protein